jgi:hypothetical protein
VLASALSVRARRLHNPIGFNAVSNSQVLADSIADHDGYLAKKPGTKVATALAVVLWSSSSEITIS